MPKKDGQNCPARKISLRFFFYNIGHTGSTVAQYFCSVKNYPGWSHLVFLTKLFKNHPCDKPVVAFRSLARLEPLWWAPSFELFTELPRNYPVQ